MRFTFEVEGKKEFDRSFNRVKGHIEDLRPVWDGLEKIMYQIEAEQFKSEGAKGRSGKWKDLTKEYAKRKAIDYPGKTILVRTGRLEKALTGKTSDSILIKEKQEFGFGTSLFYAAFHQSGTKKMPARPPISFADEQRTQIHKAIQRGLLKIMKGDNQIKLEVE